MSTGDGSGVRESAATRRDPSRGHEAAVGRGLLAVVALAALVAAAGCAAPEATEAMEVTETPEAETPTVETRGGALSFDPGTEYARLRSLLETNVPAPPSVTVLNESTLPEHDDGVASATPATFRAFGVEPAPEEREQLRYRYVAAVGATGQVRVYPGEKPRSLVRTVLVHEFVHYVQVARGDIGRVREAVGQETTDDRFVTRSIVEGVAVTVTDAYVRRHLDAEPNGALYERVDEAVPRGTPVWYYNVQYRYGARYVEGQTANASVALDVVERPPQTSEQVIHGYAPSEEPPSSLTVAVNASESDWRAVGRDQDRMGEAFLRAALGDLPRDRANAAAEGWGTDRLVVFRAAAAENASYALVTRWDGPDDAADFEAALADALSRRGTATAAGWRVDGRRATVERTSEDTVVVLLGTAGFVGNTTVRGGDGEVTVTVGGGE